MPRRTDSKRRMLDAAADLFRSQGYHATGLNQLVATGGAPKGSLYFHFPGGKEQLAAEAMQEAAARVGEQLESVARSAPDTATAVGMMIDWLATALVESEFRSGCPLATVVLDAAADSELIADACSAGYATWRAALAARLERDGVSEERAAALATVVLAAIEGALLLARAARDTTALRQVRQHLVTVLDGKAL